MAAYGIETESLTAIDLYEEKPNRKMIKMLNSISVPFNAGYGKTVKTVSMNGNGPVTESNIFVSVWPSNYWSDTDENDVGVGKFVTYNIVNGNTVEITVNWYSFMGRASWEWGKTTGQLNKVALIKIGIIVNG